MSDWKCTKEKFLEDVKNHEIEVIKDDGLYRHLRLQKPGTRSMQFDLLTWPGHLAYTGDMGDYVFSRVADMFEFFRSDKGGINPDYWSEKLLAVDKSSGVESYDEDVFRQRIHERRMEWIREGFREGTLERDERRDLWEAVDDEVLSHADDGESIAREAVGAFSHRVAGKTYNFPDFWEVSLTSFTGRYIWCCYAIAWGIAKYDESKRQSANNFGPPPEAISVQANEIRDSNDNPTK